MTDPAPDTTTLGVALIGFGFAGEIFHAPFITATPGLSLRVVASRQTARVNAACPGVRVVAEPLEAIHGDDVTMVVIATPNDSHAPLAEAALRAGKHVVVDKPFTVTLAEARGLASTAESTGGLLAVYHNRRWDSDFVGVRQLLQDGAIGEVVEFRSEIGRWRPQVRDRWRERPGPGAGLWYDLGPHLVDQALTLFGRPDAVHAALRTQRPGGLTDDWFHVRLDYPTRQVLLCSSMLAVDATPRFVVRGTTGNLVKRGGDPQERRLMAGERPGGPDWGQDDDAVLVLRDGAAPAHVAVPPGDYGQFYASMRDAVHGTGRVPVPASDAIAVMTVIAAGIQSSAEGRGVAIDAPA